MAAAGVANEEEGEARDVVSFVALQRVAGAALRGGLELSEESYQFLTNNDEFIIDDKKDSGGRRRTEGITSGAVRMFLKFAEGKSCNEVFRRGGVESNGGAAADSSAVAAPSTGGPAATAQGAAASSSAKIPMAMVTVVPDGSAAPANASSAAARKKRPRNDDRDFAESEAQKKAVAVGTEIMSLLDKMEVVQALSRMRSRSCRHTWSSWTVLFHRSVSSRPKHIDRVVDASTSSVASVSARTRSE